MSEGVSADLHAELARLRMQVDAERRARVEFEQEAERHRSALALIQSSESFRLGHAIVRVLRVPGRLVRGDAGRRPARLGPGEPRPKPKAAVPGAGATGKNGGEADKRPVARAPVLSVPPGPEPFGGLNDGHATTLVVVWGLDGESVRGVVDDVARLQMMQRHFKPLFLTDNPESEAFRRHGFLFEYFPPLEEWAARRPRHEWREAVDTRMAMLLETYRPTRTLVYEDPARRDALRCGVLDRLIGPGEVIGAGDARKRRRVRPGTEAPAPLPEP